MGFWPNQPTGILFEFAPPLVMSEKQLYDCVRIIVEAPKNILNLIRQVSSPYA